MSEQKKRPQTKMVPVQSKAIVPDRDADKSPILECHHLGIDFGGLTAVNDFNLMIGRTEIAGLIGPNGAGKTTIFNLLTKVYQPTRGSILLDGADTSKMTTAQVNRAGIARTFQNIRLFNNLSVEDHNHIEYGMWNGVFRLPKYWKEEKHAHESAMELLKIFDMQDVANAQAGSLPYGAQRRLEIVRALATNPSLLLLDEPAAGMNPSETAELMDNIVRHPRPVPDRRHAHRARHEPRHGHLRGHLRPQLRTGHRQGHARRDQEQSRRHRGVPRQK